MAVVASWPSVTTTATRVAAGDGSSIILRNRGAAAVYLGGSAVTTSDGFELDAGESFAGDLPVGHHLFAICASGTVTCHLLKVGGV